MSNASAESPKRAIRRMVSTVETIQSLFPDLWVDADDDPHPRSINEATTDLCGILDGVWTGFRQPQAPVSARQSSRADSTWPCDRSNDVVTTPETSDAAMSRIMSTVATNQLLFPELWQPIDRVERSGLSDGLRVAPGSDLAWNYDHHQQQQQQQQQQQCVRPEGKLKTTPSFGGRENANRSEDEDSSDSGIYSGTYLA